MTVSHRPAEPGDRAFVVDSWSSSFKGSHFAGLIQSEDWASIMEPQINKLLDREDTVCIVACEKKQPEFLYGFISGAKPEGQPPVVHYVYVKKPFRREGHAKGLFAALGVDPQERFTYVCRTGFVRTLKDKIPRGDWNPLVARYPENHPHRRRPL